MQSIHIGVKNYTDDMLDYIKNELKTLEKSCIVYSVGKKNQNGMTSIVCSMKNQENTKNRKSTDSEKHYNALVVQLANALTDYIINQYEEKLLLRVINTNHCYYNKEEKNEILLRALGIIHNEDSSFLNEIFQDRRRNFILRNLLDYLGVSNDLILDGFVNFRMKEYVKDLEDVVDKAVEDLITEKEYLEFIKLLKYFVKVQEPRYDVLNLIFDEAGNFKLCNTAGRNVTDECTREFIDNLSEIELSCDDLLVSSLICMAPRKLIVHNLPSFKNNELIETIENIFAGKLLICQQCESCMPYQIIGKEKK